MQSLKIYQSLWAMELRSPDQPERSHEENFRMVAEAGYDGLCVDPSVEEIPQILALKPLYENFGLESMINAFPFDIEVIIEEYTSITPVAVNDDYSLDSGCEDLNLQ